MKPFSRKLLDNIELILSALGLFVAALVPLAFAHHTEDMWHLAAITAILSLAAWSNFLDNTNPSTQSPRTNHQRNARDVTRCRQKSTLSDFTQHPTPRFMRNTVIGFKTPSTKFRMLWIISPKNPCPSGRRNMKLCGIAALLR